MESATLRHWGIKGMKWGVRRYQNKDGSLTAAGRKRYGYTDGGHQESDEERRERVLKSSNASEIYKNRDVLTTAEIQDRINRIHKERELASLAESTKKTGMDYVNSALAWGKKIDEAYKFIDESHIGKAVKKQLGIDTSDDKKFDLGKVYKNIDKLSSKEIKDAAERITNAKRIKDAWESANGESNKESSAEVNEKALKEAQKAVDDYAKKIAKGKVPSSIVTPTDYGNFGEYRKVGKDLVDAKLDTRMSTVENEIVLSGQYFVSGLPDIVR